MTSYRILTPLTGPGPTYVHTSGCPHPPPDGFPDGYVMCATRADRAELATRVSQRVAWITHRIPTDIIIAPCCDTGTEAVAS